jgi:hypothetical protein
MNKHHTLSYWYRKRDGLLEKLADIGPFVDASLVTIARTCGNPGCKCAQGEKHRSRYLTYKAQTGEGEQRRMKTQTLYVPLALEKQVDSWTAEYKRLKLLTKEIADVQKMIVRTYVSEKGRGSDGQR